MKLNQRYEDFPAHHYPEYQDFKRRMHRQSIGFGMHTGQAFDPGVIDHYARRGQKSRAAELKRILAAVSTGADRLLGQLVSFVRNVRCYTNNRATIAKLLRYSDYLLTDMGFERNQLQYLAETNGSLDELVSDRKPGNVIPEQGPSHYGIDFYPPSDKACANDVEAFNRAA